jgi:hypothetical protein
MEQIATPTSSGVVWEDDFQDGFRVGGDDARWFHWGVGDYLGDDGVVETGSFGLRVVSSGTNPDTGRPAFVRTLGQEGQNGLGLPGTLDHVKWLVFVNHQSANGFHGFDVPAGHQLSVEAWLAGETYGTEGHPFGEHVADPQDDLRLASVTMPLLDEETSTVFNFSLSNRHVYAVYERLPFARQQLGNYAAFVYQVPVAERSPGQAHHLKITYDRSAGGARWELDGEEIYRLDRLGYHLASREHLVVDHGGEETPVEPHQFSCGLGMFTSPDYARPGKPALIRLSTAEDYYYDPATGAPAPQSFVDDESKDSNRLFGQGARMDVRRYVVSTNPVV